MDRSQTEAMVRKIAEDFGTVHVLINNAGMAQVGTRKKTSSGFMNVTYVKAGILPLQGTSLSLLM